MKALFTPYIYIFFLGLIFTSIHAQNWELKIIPTDSISAKQLIAVTYLPVLSNESDIHAEIENVLNQLAQKGVFAPHLELMSSSDQLYIYHLSVVKVLDKITLYFDENLSKTFLSAYQLDQENHSITIPIEETDRFLKSIITLFEEKGYPFVTLRIINQKLVNHQLSAFVQINLTQKRTIDKIIIEGYPNFPLSFLKHQTPLKVGTNFNQQKIRKTSDAIQRLSFVHVLKEPAVLFTTDSTLVYLYLTKKKAHQLDGLIGFNNTENNSKLKLHGFIDVQLNNLFNKAEQFSVYWQNTTQKQSTFKLSALIPYLWKSPISLDVHFDLQKQDSTFLTSTFRAGLGYQINNHTLNTSVQNYASNLLSTSTQAFLKDYSKTLYGLMHTYQLENNDFFFSKVFESKLAFFTGNRKITTENSSQQKVTILMNYTWKINQQQYLFVQNQSAKMIGNNFLINELLLIGGTNTMRGFNENQLYSSAYSIFNLEYRLITSADSYFYTITDYGTSKNNTDTSNLKMFGLGLGYVFKVNSGFLNINYSIGKFSNTSFDFNQSKVHLKWLQTF